jgi:hypothetical protein
MTMMTLAAFGCHGVRRGPDRAMSGVVLRYEAGLRRLMIGADAGEIGFQVPEGAQVQEGARTFRLDRLLTADGCRVKVRYQDVERSPVATAIRISCGFSASRGTPAR